MFLYYNTLKFNYFYYILTIFKLVCIIIIIELLLECFDIKKSRKKHFNIIS